MPDFLSVAQANAKCKMQNAKCKMQNLILILIIIEQP